ncbi:peptidoglycan D,D-transpeptidase FtsI family protein [Varunaivibrio sulfuroxidans]|uniref:Cell division protein FtsI (Penicillin-binding protein 3) n=1 Tax=Varunaivibrio sulfuroxidans TaxID=1773489 RepID=A0A4R3J8A2_9PROT|nr:penicillin-binding protein 2 [Varunaivibrio sulfuroxidans]TCS62189.1 cell division protein FtsI (penicillin-binding protein 3) [Varunaivibrio sulfuroxidans]WES30616.1 penicillin-binding protein 2 [Varunaivibrio sulfuroxidans]
MTAAIDPDTLTFEDLNAKRVHREGLRAQAMETGRTRLLVTGLVFAMAFIVIGGRLIDLTAFDGKAQRLAHRRALSQDYVVSRADIVDRNGFILATSLPTQSLYADTKEIIDPATAARRLVGVLNDLDVNEVRRKLSSGARFIWIKRNLTPNQVYDVNRLGIPGLAFREEDHRVYPNGPQLAQVLGFTDVDGKGIAGVEKQFDARLRANPKPLVLSFDLRVQGILHEELARAMTQFSAKGAAGVVLDVRTGELVAMVSLPDFDPNVSSGALGDAGFNRVTKGVYEMGSTFKLFNTAMALDTGTVTLRDGYDASKPIHVARFLISDFHAKKRWLSVPEILVYSSNIGSAKMALDVGTKEQQDYLGRLGMLSPASIELPEIGSPLTPSPWRDINTMTIAYGHGIAVTPLQLAGGVMAVVDGGIFRPMTVLKRAPGDVPKGRRIFAKKTSDEMRALMRLVVRYGTGKKAAAPGLLVGGKTGTAEKEKGGRYVNKALISSFIGAFPMNAPRYVVLALLDEPKGTKATFNYATGGWVAAPVVGRVIARMAPIEDIYPETGVEKDTNTPGNPLSIPSTMADARTNGRADPGAHDNALQRVALQGGAHAPY